MKSKKKQREEQVALVVLHMRAQVGTEDVGLQLVHARRVLDGLLEPRHRFTGRKHGHQDPYGAAGCGWCSNIRSWRKSVAILEAVTPLAALMEAQVKLWARNHTQAATWEIVKEAYPRMRREVVRQLWSAARQGSSS